MKIARFVSYLESLGIRLWLDKNQLRYQAPKRALTAALRAEIIDHKAEIMSFLSQANQMLSRPIEPVAREDEDEDKVQFPLSFAQQRLWFLAQLEGANEAYNMMAALRLDGPLDIELFNASWQQLEERHETLRTTFPQVDGQPRQQINPPGFNLEVIDLSESPGIPQEAEVARLSRQESTRPFDLVNGPLWRVTLLRLGREQHVLLLTIHHIISDGWSMGVLMRDFFALYAGHHLPNLAIQYADFAVWQREWLTRDVLAEQLDYWKAQLASTPPLLTLPTDHPRPAQQSYRGANLSFTLPKTLLPKLVSLSGENNTTLFMTLQAAFAVLLSRYSAQEDICVGSPIANRQVPEVENLIGFFANTLVLRNDLSGNPSFRDFLERVRQVALHAYQRQALPFELLVESLQPERSLSHSPLFQVMFILNNKEEGGDLFSHLTTSPIEVEYPRAKFDLTLTMQEQSEGLIGSWEYNTDLFEHTTIERMSGHWKSLLEGIVANPNLPLADLPLLTEAEKHQILVEWNDTAADYPLDQCIHQFFEQHAAAERTASAVAVLFDGQAVTYRELNARANQLAHYLIRLGVGPETLVGICVERSIEMVVGLLGILKAGGAYVPLDPTYPSERLAFILEDAQLSILLTQERFVPALPVMSNKLCLDQEWLYENEPDSNPVTRVKPEQLAYCIYTSGSTGRPKGAMNTHQGISNRLLWMQEAYQLTPSDRILHKTPFTFDVSVWEFFWPLMFGARLVVARPEGHKEPQYLVDVIKQEQITTLHFVPSMLQVFVEVEGLEALSSLKRVICSGEALPVPLMQRFFERVNAQLHNLYGPTEAAIDVTYWECDPSSPIVPIGRPVANTQLYILDSHQQPVPIGVPGELHLGGVQVARGYLNRPQLTKQKFIPNPFGRGWLYKTGDLCRYLPDGNVEFVGRTDYQVKIRGFRIELGEIEANLRQCAAVREAVVVVRQEASGPRLVAYMVGELKGGSTELAKVLRPQLAQKLPDYMIPQAFVSLEVMPLTPNGKINRRALPAPEYRLDSAQKLLPRTPQETILAAIWQDVLGIEQVGVTDNFFQIGGDSIMSIQIVSRAREAGLQLTPNNLFRYQTIAELASVAKEVQKTQAEQGVLTGSLPLTPIQHWFLGQAWQEPHHFNQSFLLDLHSGVNPRWVQEAVRALLTHHDAWRLRFERQGDSWRQVLVAPEPEVPFEVIDLSDLSPNEQVARLQNKANQLQASLNLSQGPLVRVALFQSPTFNRLLIIVHHLAVDGVSWRILFEDLQRAYQQQEHGQPIQLPAKTTSFKEWSTLLNEKGAKTLWAEREYWTQLSTYNPPLPVDDRLGTSTSANNNASAATISTQLSKAQTQALLSEVPAIYHTQINDLLLTALLLAFQEWTGLSTLLLTLEGHGREELFEATLFVDLSRTVGWFTSIFPLRLERTTSSLGDTIKSVKEQLRRIPNRGIGYGILRYLSPAAVPEVEAEVSFNYLGQFGRRASEPGPLINAFATESSGLPHSPDGLRPHLLDINGIVIGGHLQVSWTYSRNFHRAETIQNLANRYINALEILIAHCQNPETGGYTPSDFSAATVNQKQLDKLIRRIKTKSKS